MVDAEYEELNEGEGELGLADTDSLPWLESDEDEDDAGGLDTGQIPEVGRTFSDPRDQHFELRMVGKKLRQHPSGRPSLQLREPVADSRPRRLRAAKRGRRDDAPGEHSCPTPPPVPSRRAAVRSRCAIPAHCPRA